MSKVANYSDEQTKALLEGYAEGKEPAELGEMLGKTVRSIVAKLVREGVYKSEAKTPGKRVMLKSEMVAEIAKLLGKDEEVLESLEKATGTALLAVLAGLRDQE